MADLPGAEAGAASVSELKRRLQRAIRHDGPMSVAAFMAMCLHDREHGYYATRPGLGRDFTTAPEISQVFGELLGGWAVHEWQAMGSPAKFDLIELGPGRGAMMADMLRTARMAPDFLSAMQLRLVEASPALRAVQLEALGAHNPTHHAGLEEIPPGPAIIIANEFLDCLPVRQFVVDGDKWRERQVGFGENEELAFGLGPTLEPMMEIGAADAVELAAGLEAVIEVVAGRLKANGGRALFIDYGPGDAHPTDTLRAFKAGAQVDPLAEPGACDMTADVDFLTLRATAEAAGVVAFGPVPQGGFLMSLGAAQRAEQLARANPATADQIIAAVEKLVAPDDMGERFKVMCLAPDGAPAPAGFAVGGMS